MGKRRGQRVGRGRWLSEQYKGEGAVKGERRGGRATKEYDGGVYLWEYYGGGELW